MLIGGSGHYLFLPVLSRHLLLPLRSMVYIAIVLCVTTDLV